MVQQALAFPFEHTTGLRDFSVNYDGGGASAQTMTLGVTGTVLNALWKLDALVSGVNANLTAYLNTSNRVVISDDADNGFTLDWTDTDLGTLFGFRSNLSGDSIYTATDPPKFLWLPECHSFDTEQFDEEINFQGESASDGSLSGVRIGDETYERTIRWDINSATNIYKSATTDSFSFGGTQYPEEERCLQYLLKHAMTSSPQEDTAEGLSTKGCYWIPDIEVFQGTSPTVALTQQWDGGDVRVFLDSSPDRFVFCHATEDGWEKPKASIPVSNQYYQVGLRLRACPGSAQDWNAP
jgi:hypothetical protein